METICLIIHFPVFLKVIFCVWLTAPNFQGSFYIYTHWIKPNYDRHEEDIDNLIVDLRYRSMKYVKQTFWDILYLQTLQTLQDDPYAQSKRKQFVHEFISLIQEGVIVDLLISENEFLSYKCFVHHHILNLKPITRHVDTGIAYEIHLLHILSIMTDANKSTLINIMIECRANNEVSTKCLTCRCDSEDETSTLCSGLQIYCMDFRGKSIQALHRLGNVLSKRKVQSRFRAWKAFSSSIRKDNSLRNNK